jgi:hypothetical protein
MFLSSPYSGRVLGGPSRTFAECLAWRQDLGAPSIPAISSDTRRAKIGRCFSASHLVQAVAEMLFGVEVVQVLFVVFSMVEGIDVGSECVYIEMLSPE